jgi:hypothetical protein
VRATKLRHTPVINTIPKLQGKINHFFHFFRFFLVSYRWPVTPSHSLLCAPSLLAEFLKIIPRR